MSRLGSPNGPQNQVQTLVFYDFETTGLFEKSTEYIREHPRVVPGDKYRDTAAIFRTYADEIDSNHERPCPRITEMSFVVVPRELFEEGAKFMQQKCMDEQDGRKCEIRHQVPIRILAQQINPELSSKQWEDYEKKRISVPGFYLKKSDLLHQPTFAESWPMLHTFLSNLKGPVAMVAHNGLRFDCRVLLSELRRTNMLADYPIPSKVHFLDSYISFLDIEKKYHEDVATVMENINWKLVSEAVLRKRPIIDEQEPTTSKKYKQAEDDQDSVNENGDNIRGEDDPPSDTDSDCIIDYCNVKPSTINLKRPLLVNAPDDSPPRTNQIISNEGWRSAPAKLIIDKPTLKELSQTNPFYFMRTSSWAPAKIRRMKSDFFERKNDHDWNFSFGMTRDYFTKRGNFRLFTLYAEIIGGTYIEHHAFDDCVALLQICMAYGSDFLKYMDTHATQLLPLSAPINI